MSNVTKNKQQQAAERPPAVAPALKKTSSLSLHQYILDLHNIVGNAAISPLLTAQKGAGSRHIETARPETTSFDVTGRYESADGRYSLHINQAGHLIIGNWRYHGSGGGAAPSVMVNAFEATVVASQPARISLAYSRINDDVVVKGRATAYLRGELVVLALEEQPTGGGGVLLGRRVVELSQRSQDPLIAPGVLGLDDVALAKASEQQAGLTAADEQRISALAKRLANAVGAYVSASEGIPRAAAATTVNAIARNEQRSLGSQRGIVLRRLREQLSEVGYGQSHALVPVWDWLQIICSTHPDHTRELQAFLQMDRSGFREGAGIVKHKYRYKTLLVGAEGKLVAGIGVYAGGMIIEKLSPDQWTKGFSVSQVTLSGGAGAGVNFGGESSWSEFETPFPWEPRNFVGSYDLVEGVKMIAGPIEASPEGSAIMIFHGDGLFPPLRVDGSGYTKVFGAGLGGSAAITKGHLTRAEEATEIERPLTEPPRPVDEARAYEDTHTSFFAVNNPILTNEGGSALRVFAARHRAALVNPETKVLIEGFASPTGTEPRNMELSYLRAANVRQRLQELLGAELRAGVEISALSDEPARQAGVTGEAQEWRAVHLKINGVVVLRL